MSSSDEFKCSSGITAKTEVNGEVNDTNDEDFVILAEGTHTDRVLENPMEFSVSGNVDFTSTSTRDNSEQDESINVTSETESAGIDVKEDVPIPSLATEILNTRQCEQDQLQNDTTICGPTSEEEINGKKTTTFEAITSPDGHEQATTETVEKARLPTPGLDDEINADMSSLTKDNMLLSHDVKEDAVNVSLATGKLNLRPDSEDNIKNETNAFRPMEFSVSSNLDFTSTYTRDTSEIDVKEDVPIPSLATEILNTSPDGHEQAITEAVEKASTEEYNGDNSTIDNEIHHRSSHDVISSKNPMNDIDLLLIGKTGNGKSRTGNTILRRDVFESTDSASSVTQEVQHGFVEYDKRRIKVVDCPGIEDTNNMDDVEKATNYLIETMGDVVIKHPDGYHAFLLLVRYGVRCTKEDKCVFKTLKSIFGEEIISRFSILLMTHGDNFYNENEKNKSFKQWCSEQTGVLNELMTECGNRVVLFDNKTQDQEKLDSQMKTLLKTIDNLQSRGMRYDHEYFQRALKNREYLLVEAKLPRILQETNEECSIISSELDKLNDNLEESIELLKRFLNRIFEYRSKVLSEDNKTGALSQALAMVDSFYSMIDNRLKVAIEIRQKEKDSEEVLADMLKRHSEEMNSLKKSQEEENEKMEKKWQEQEERKEAEMKRMSENYECERIANQRSMEELEKKCRESNADDKIQFEKQMAALQSSMKDSNERAAKDKKDLEDNFIRMRNEDQDKQKKLAEEEIKRMEDKFNKDLKNVNDQFAKQNKDMEDQLKEINKEKKAVKKEMDRLAAENKERRMTEEKLIHERDEEIKKYKNERREKKERAEYAMRLEKENKKIVKKFHKQEERKEAEMKRMSENYERDRITNQRSMEELEKKHREAKADDKSQFENQMAALLTLMKDSNERAANDKKDLKDNFIRMRNEDQEIQKERAEAIKKELEKKKDKGCTIN